MIEHLLGLLGSHLVEARLKRDALEPDPGEALDGSWRMRYSAFFAGFWLFMGLFWIAATALCLLAIALERMDWTLAAASVPFAVFGAFGLLSARDAFSQELELSHWGVSEFRSGDVRAAVPWGAIRQVAFLGYLDAYRVTPQTGRPLQFSRHMLGLWRFKWFLLRYGPKEAISSVRKRLLDPRVP